MNALTLHGFRNVLPDRSVLTGGIFWREPADASAILKTFEAFEAPSVQTGAQIDRALDAYVRQYCHQAIVALGISFYLPRFHEVSGGLVGSPHRHSESAGGLSEPLGSGLSAVSFPGGPGLIIKGRPSELEAIIARSNMEQPFGMTQVADLLFDLRELGIQAALCVADGCGPNQDGGTGLLQNHAIELLANTPGK